MENNLITLEEAVNFSMDKKKFFINIKEPFIIEYRYPFHLNECGYDSIEAIQWERNQLT